jgi:transcriptional regulator with XRE-family HTH domain
MQSFQTFLKRVGQNIRKFRTRAGWTQVEVSDKSGIPQRRYQELEAGRANFTLKSLFRIAHTFGKTPRELL